MQKTTSMILLSLCLVLSAATAEARNTRRTTTNNTASSEHVESYQAAPEHHHSNVTFDLGLSTIFPVPTISATPAGSLTGIIHLTGLDAVQVFLGISGTNGGFGFGVGGLYKRTVMGNESAGLHLGGGMGLGTASNNAGTGSTSFAMNISAIMGAHFEVPGTQIAFHFDGGPVFSLVSISGVNGVGSSTITSFAMGPLGAMLGASAVYQF